MVETTTPRPRVSGTLREKRVSILEPSKEPAKEKEPCNHPDVDISRLTAMNDTTVENNTDKSIDFNAQL